MTVIQFPKNALHFSQAELNKLGNRLRKTGLFGFVEESAISQVCEGYPEAFQTSDLAAQSEAIDRVVGDLEVLRRALLILAKEKGEPLLEPWLVAIASMAGRMAACAATLFDIVTRLPPGDAPCPSLEKNFLDGLNLHNRVVDRVFEEGDKDSEE